MINRILLTLSITVCLFVSASAQDEVEKNGFQKDKLFTGGSISLGFGSNTFQVGGSPFLGYSLARWVDAGITVNYNYSSIRNAYFVGENDKIRESTYGGGAFTRIYPVDFLFINAQFEHNFTSQKFIPGNGDPSEKNKVEANSLLLGAGYATGRYPGGGQPFFYISLLFDVLGNQYSPYTRSDGSIMPILRGGVQVPLFQGKNRRF